MCKNVYKISLPSFQPSARLWKLSHLCCSFKAAFPPATSKALSSVKTLQRGRIFSNVWPFCERAVSDLRPCIDLYGSGSLTAHSKKGHTQLKVQPLFVLNHPSKPRPTKLSWLRHNIAMFLPTNFANVIVSIEQYILDTYAGKTAGLSCHRCGCVKLVETLLKVCDSSEVLFQLSTSIEITQN